MNDFFVVLRFIHIDQPAVIVILADFSEITVGAVYLTEMCIRDRNYLFVSILPWM